MKISSETIQHEENPSYVVTSVPPTKERNFEDNVETFLEDAGGLPSEHSAKPEVVSLVPRKTTTANWP